MKLSARGITIVVSLAVHGAVGAMALSVAHEKKQQRATTVALADQAKKEKKPEPPKPPPPPPPPPKPKAAPPKIAPAPVAAPVAAPAPVAAAAAAPIATDIAMSNDTGMDMGTGQKPQNETKAPIKTSEEKPKPAAATVKTPLKVDTPPPVTNAEGQCSEPPGKPEPSFKTDIEYTEEARAAGVEGRLVLKVTVDADGNVTNVQVVSGVDPALDAAAIQTVKTWRFKPALACGKPVSGGTYTIARRFVLGD